MENEEIQLTEKKLSVERGKRGVLKVIFGRTAIIIALLLVQLLVLLVAFQYLRQYIDMVYFYAIYQVFMAVLVIWIINQQGNPAFKLAWIVPILVLPVSGALFYVFIKLQLGSRMLNKRLYKLAEETKGYSRQDEETMLRLEDEHRQVVGLARYLSEGASFPVYQNTTVKYFPLGEDKFEELKIQLRRAKHFIFL